MGVAESLRRLQLRTRLVNRGAGRAQGDYWRSVITLTTGSLASQAIGIMSMLAVARLYAPGEFGAYALFIAYAGILSLIATAKYDSAIFMARRPEEAADLALLATAFSLLAGVMILALTPFLDFVLATVTNRPFTFMLLLSLATVTGGAMTATTAWAMQLKQFSMVTQGRMAQSIVTAGLAIGLGLAHWDAIGLIIGYVAGQTVICALLGWRLSLLTHARRFTWRKARVRASRNVRFPQYLLLGEALNYLGNNALTFLTPGLFGAAALGQFNMGQRVAGIPISVIGTSMSGVFRSAISPQHSDRGDVPAAFRSSLVRLSIVGALLTLPLLLAGPLLFQLAFGAKWHDAGFYVQILSPLMFIRFVVSPLSVVLLLANRQNLDVLMQCLFVVAALVAAAIGTWTGSFLYTVIVVTALQGMIYGLYFIVSWRLAQGMSRQ